MYGKIFASMYEGSMVGSGPVVFAVWGYCISKADIDGTVLLNPALLAPIIGTSRGEIESAIAFLQEPDAHSKNPEHEGRRLLHQTGHLYFLVSHEYYRAMKNNEERREYMREYMRKKRENENVNVNKVNEVLTKVNPASASSYTSSSDKGGCKGGESTKKPPFTKPTADDVKAYIIEKGVNVEADSFIDHYESNGWMVGKVKMKDWRATVRKWGRGNNGKPAATPQQTKSYYIPESERT
jgi:hypothetical protein